MSDENIPIIGSNASGPDYTYENIHSARAVVVALVENGLAAERAIEFIPQVFNAFKAATEGTASAPAETPSNVAASPQAIKKSVSADGIVSFEDGKSYKSLKRHLSARGMTPEQYRTKWGLPVDYPMVAPSYAAKRSELAKASGLGRKTNPFEQDPTPEQVAAETPVEPARPKRKTTRKAKLETPAEPTPEELGAVELGEDVVIDPQPDSRTAEQILAEQG